MDQDTVYEEAEFGSSTIRRYENPATHHSSGTNHQSRTTADLDVIKKKRRPSKSGKIYESMKWILLCMVLIIQLVLLVLLLTKFNVQNSLEKFGGKWSEKVLTPESCLRLRQQGKIHDGIYVIWPDSKQSGIVAYCDMTTDGGGWTLVASIHEDNISVKCDVHDMWSSYVDRYKVLDREDLTNWGNDMTFGNLHQSMRNDYKSMGYSELQSSDVMIWHVPPNTTIDEMKKRSKLQYRTENQFLKQHGGNLKSVFTQFPVKVIQESKLTNVSEERADKVMKALAEEAPFIKSLIPDWHQYQYDSSDRISNDSMFRTRSSNEVYLRSSNCYYFRYKRQRRECRGDSVVSNVTHPYIAVGVFPNAKAENTYYRSSASFEPPDTSSYNSTAINDTVTVGNYKIVYHLFQYSHPNYPTISNFHFSVFNFENWNSKEPSSFDTRSDTPISLYRRRLYTEVKLQSSPSNFIMGFMLLSRKNGKVVTQELAGSVSLKILQALSSFNNLFKDISGPGMTLSVPVTFDVGSHQDVQAMIPSKYRTFVEPGFIQFRPVNSHGYSNAICPGVKVEGFTSEYVCIGGVSNSIGNHATCGDFAGWEGSYSDQINALLPNGSAHSWKDISSTILIFYR